MNNHDVRERPATARRKEKLLAEICAYVDTHLEEGTSLRSVASYFQVSISTVTQLFQHKSDKTFHQYLTQRRMVVAAERIAKGVPLEEVGKQVGYADHSSFYRAFKLYYGVSPREYRRRQTKE